MGRLSTRPTENYRRPWVVRDPRIPKIVIPARSFTPSLTPKHPWWKSCRRIVHDTLASGLPSVIAVAAVTLGLLLLLSGY